MANTQNITDDEVTLAASILAKLQPGYLPQLLFDQINRLHVASTVVVVPLRKTADGWHVLLSQRGHGPTDPVWPGHWHLPGTMLRPSDRAGSYDDAFERLFGGELQGTATTKPVFIQTFFTHTKRGPEHTPLYYVLVDGTPATGQLFPVDALPQPIIEHERAYIKEAVDRAIKNNL